MTHSTTTRLRPMTLAEACASPLDRCRECWQRSAVKAGLCGRCYRRLGGLKASMGGRA
jgi:hypothetical protein